MLFQFQKKPAAPKGVQTCWTSCNRYRLCVYCYMYTSSFARFSYCGCGFVHCARFTSYGKTEQLVHGVENQDSHMDVNGQCVLAFVFACLGEKVMWIEAYMDLLDLVCEAKLRANFWSHVNCTSVYTCMWKLPAYHTTSCSYWWLTLAKL